MSHLPQLNYTTLGDRDVFPLDLSSFLDHDILIGTALRRIGEDLPDPTKPLELEIWLLKKTIPFEQFDSNPWLLDPSTSLNEYATRPFRAEKLSDVWTARDPRSLHAILQRVKTPRLKRKLSNAEYPATRKRSNLERAANDHGTESSFPPDSSSETSAIAERQDAHLLSNGRAPENRAPDVRLFHPAFENFTRRYRGTETLANEEKAAVHQFLVRSAAYYGTESARLDAISPSLKTLLGRGLVGGTIAYSTTQTVVPAPLLFFKLKNEIGTGAGDPTLQASLSYHKYWSQNKDESRASCCPAFLLALMGPWICVLGAVFTDKPIVQPLTPLLWLGSLHARKTQYGEVTRLFASLSMGIQELEEFYSGVDFKVVSEARLFPHITTFTDSGTGHEVQFTYEKPVGLTHEGKAAFIANTQDGQNITVKFTETYNDTGHSLLAAQRIAPPLLASDRSACSDFTMVVMGYGDGMQAVSPQGFYQAPSGSLDMATRALRILHHNGLVFGDLRPQNILISKNWSLTQLVGFELCGKVGEGEYPADIEHMGIEWPLAEGVVPGGRLQVEHDNEMLRKLRDWGSY